MFYCTELDNNMVIIDVRWFNKVGIVLLFDKITKEMKSYISNIDGSQDEYSDIRSIAMFGDKFPLDAAKKLFPFHNFDKVIEDLS